jgi:RimJ/RimL family protein N-acetyltransferase
MLIRRTEKGDLDALLELFDEVAAERVYIGTEPGYDRAQKRRGFESRIEDDENPSFVAIDGDALVGSAGVHTHAEYGPTLGMLIATSHRRQGVRRAMMGALDTWATARGVPALNLFVFAHNTNAIAFYRELGYVEIEHLERDVTRQNGDVWDTILMRKAFA